MNKPVQASRFIQLDGWTDVNVELRHGELPQFHEVKDVMRNVKKMMDNLDLY